MNEHGRDIPQNFCICFDINPYKPEQVVQCKLSCNKKSIALYSQRKKNKNKHQTDIANKDHTSILYGNLEYLQNEVI